MPIDCGGRTWLRLCIQDVSAEHLDYCLYNINEADRSEIQTVVTGWQHLCVSRALSEAKVFQRFDTSVIM